MNIEHIEEAGVHTLIPETDPKRGIISTILYIILGGVLIAIGLVVKNNESESSTGDENPFTNILLGIFWVSGGIILLIAILPVLGIKFGGPKTMIIDLNSRTITVGRKNFDVQEGANLEVNRVFHRTTRTTTTSSSSGGSSTQTQVILTTAWSLTLTAGEYTDTLMNSVSKTNSEPLIELFAEKVATILGLEIHDKTGNHLIIRKPGELNISLIEQLKKEDVQPLAQEDILQFDRYQIHEIDGGYEIIVQKNSALALIAPIFAITMIIGGYIWMQSIDGFFVIFSWIIIAIGAIILIPGINSIGAYTSIQFTPTHISYRKYGKFIKNKLWDSDLDHIERIQVATSWQNRQILELIGDRGRLAVPGNFNPQEINNLKTIVSKMIVTIQR